MTSSSTPHLLLDNNTLSRSFHNQQQLQQQQQQLQQQQLQQQQAYSSYYQSFGRTLGKERKSKNKISSWLKTKLTRSESTGCRQTTLMRRTIDRPYAEFSYSGANTLRQHQEFNPGKTGGGSLALLLRHKNCPTDQRQCPGDRLPQRPRLLQQVGCLKMGQPRPLFCLFSSFPQYVDKFRIQF